MKAVIRLFDQVEWDGYHIDFEKKSIKPIVHRGTVVAVSYDKITVHYHESDGQLFQQELERSKVRKVPMT